MRPDELAYFRQASVWTFNAHWKKHQEDMEALLVATYNLLATYDELEQHPHSDEAYMLADLFLVECARRGHAHGERALYSSCLKGRVWSPAIEARLHARYGLPRL